MTVQELIDELKQFDPNMPVVSFEDDSDYGMRWLTPYVHKVQSTGIQIYAQLGEPDSEFIQIGS